MVIAVTTPDGSKTITFGKHKSKTIEEVPSSYLRWMVDFLEEDGWIDEAAAELKFRDDNDTHFEE